MNPFRDIKRSDAILFFRFWKVTDFNLPIADPFFAHGSDIEYY